eukprot:1657904-Pleurochrysis_carterae.AAC.1
MNLGSGVLLACYLPEAPLYFTRSFPLVRRPLPPLRPTPLQSAATHHAPSLLPPPPARDAAACT